MSKYIIKWVAPKLYKIYFDHYLNEQEVKNTLVEMGYHCIRIEYFRDVPVALASKLR